MTDPLFLQNQKNFWPVKDGKVRSCCSLCQNFCGLFAYVQDGRVVKLEGDPDNPRNFGHLCAKGLSGFLPLYSPKRVTKPLIRTNSVKGLGVDPMWKEISWNEAIDIIAQRIRAVRDKYKTSREEHDPTYRLGGSSRILILTFDHPANYYGTQRAWMTALNAFSAMIGPMWCGNAIHPPSYLNTSTWELTPDAEYSKYILLIGSQAGSIIHYDTMNVARHIAEKRPGGVKVVSVDPVCSFSASKAEEWVPIRPGTDTAFIMALVNLLVNDYHLYDAKFLKEKTNSPYLLRQDGLFARDSKSSKPLIWDPIDGTAKTFDDPTIKDYALEGEYMVNDAPCKPAFQVIKEYVKKYTPETVSDTTSIPPETIRRIAKEMGEAAQIGSTITIDGVELPHRPVSVVWYRGLSAHRHAFLSGFAAMMLPTLLGAIQVPGGIMGHPPVREDVDSDGLMVSKPFMGAPYPPRPVKKPKRIDLIDLFPVTHTSYFMIVPTLVNPEAFGLKREELEMPEILITWRENVVRNGFSPDVVAEALKKIPFIVAFNIDADETMQFADVVLPELHHLEKLVENVYQRVGEPGYWYGCKPALKPPFDPPWDRLVNMGQILLEIADRAGFLNDVYAEINRMWGLNDSPYELDVNKKYPYDEMMDRRLKVWLGPQYGLDWLLGEDGGLLVWNAKPHEKWKGAFRKGRAHLYYEFMIKAGHDVEKVVKDLGIPWDTSDYQPIPDWKPCFSYAAKNNEYDLFAVNFKVPMMAHGVGRFNPLVQNLIEYHDLDSVLMHPKTAAKKGINEGDEIWIETAKGRKVKAVVRLSERTHPEVLGTVQFSLQRGADFNALASLDKDTIDFLTSAVDSCLLIKVYKT